MSLEVAFSSIKNGLSVAKQLMKNTADNISHSRVENYSKKELVLSTHYLTKTESTVIVAGVKNQIDNVLANAVMEHASKLSFAETVNRYSQEIQQLFGDPDSDVTIDHALGELESSLKALHLRPEDKSQAVGSSKDVANRISSLAYGLQNLRLKADKNLAISKNIANDLITKIHGSNGIVTSSVVNSEEDALVLEDRRQNIKLLAEKIGLKTYFNDDNQVLINTINNHPLLNGYSAYKFEHKESAINNFINDDIIPDITANLYDRDGNPIDSYDIRSKLNLGSYDKFDNEMGEIAALQKIRDYTIPKILDQLDHLAHTLSANFNQVHNTGASFPGSSILTGERPVSLTDNLSFSGKAMIALTDSKGNPLVKHDGKDLSPLTLNLTQLKSGTAPGEYNVETLINEINQYFSTSAVTTTTKLGNIDDIKIAATSPLSTTPNGIFNFDFELTNESQLNSVFEVQSVTVTDPACNGLVGGLPAPIQSTAGERFRTNSPIQVDFAGGSGGPYTIAVNVKVTDSLGHISTSVINYQIDDNPSDPNIQNVRYNATSTSGSAVINAPNNVKPFLMASLVDKNGIAVSPGQSGFLQINTFDDNVKITIDNLTSSGGRASSNIKQTLGFGEYFELNNFFSGNINRDPVTNDQLIAGSAINLSLRPDIVKNPNLMSTGKLSPSQSDPELQNVGSTSSSARLQFLGNPVINDTININGTIFTFVAVSSSDTEITIGATLPDTLDNIATKLNVNNLTNSATVNHASYESNLVDSIIITAKAKGADGNNINISGSFASINASINNSTPSNTPNGRLRGGSDIAVTNMVKKWSYGLAIGDNSTVRKFTDLFDSNFHFTNDLNDVSQTFLNYTTSIIINSTLDAESAKKSSDAQSLLYDSFKSKFDSSREIDLDQETINMVEYQQYFTTLAKAMVIVRDMFQELLSAVR